MTVETSGNICGSEVETANLRKTVEIEGRVIGDKHSIFVVAEIGINHNGSVDTAKKLIDAASSCGCDAVKFQKRTVKEVYTPEELACSRESVFGVTNGDLKNGLEFGEEQYAEIDKYCREKDILWFASPWDKKSVDFLDKFDIPCYKIASACLTDSNLLKHIKSKGKPVILSTGMSTQEEIDKAVSVLGGTDNLIMMHCVSTYPTQDEELNLLVIKWLRQKYDCPVGYSGHEIGLFPSIFAMGLGACVIERHITLDRAMWGSDQAASLEIGGLQKLAREAKDLRTYLGNGDKFVLDSEKPILDKLRRVK